MTSPQRVRFVAEVSSNHHRDLKRCRAFIDTAAHIGCAAVKFQLFRVNELFSPEALAHDPQLRERVDWELAPSYLPELAAMCNEAEIAFSCTPFHLAAVEQLQPWVSFFKVASYELLWHDLLKACADTGKPVVLSTGMATFDEIDRAVDVLEHAGCRELTLLHCISGYPTPAEQCNLAVIDAMRERYPQARIGWSDHSVNAAVVSRAVHGHQAEMVEFHLDLDGKGEEFSSGHCWLPQQIAGVIRSIDVGLSAIGDPNKPLADCEADDRSWRADPVDGLRPLVTQRRQLTAAQVPLASSLQLEQPGDVKQAGQAMQAVEPLVSQVCLGTAQFGMPYGIANRSGMPVEDEVLRIVHAAFAAGVRWFDTAASYGLAEKRLGKAFSALRAAEGAGDVRVVSKLDPQVNASDRGAVIAAVEQSLERLKLSRLEALLVHRTRDLEGNRALSQALAELISSGKVGGVGVSVYSPDEIHVAKRYLPLGFVQCPLNAVDRRFDDPALFPQDCRVFFRSVFLQGLLLLTPEDVSCRLPQGAAAVRRVQRFADDHGVALAPFLLATALQTQVAARWVIGMETEAQLTTNLELLDEAQQKPAVHAARAWLAERHQFSLDLIDPTRWEVCA